MLGQEMANIVALALAVIGTISKNLMKKYLKSKIMKGISMLLPGKI